MLPHDRHYGKDIAILLQRRGTYKKAYEANPLRWSRHPKQWLRQEVVYINQAEAKKDLQLAS